MIGSINLRQARFLSDAYEADLPDSIEDYPNNHGFPLGSYPDSSIIALHKLLKRLNGVDVPEKDRLDAYLRQVTRRNRRPKTLHSLYTSIVFFLGMIRDNDYCDELPVFPDAQRLLSWGRRRSSSILE